MFHYFRVSKISLHKGGMPGFSVEIFFSHSTRKPRRGTLLCFRNFVVSKNSMDKSVGAGGVS